jgi:hypothetical protein
MSLPNIDDYTLAAKPITMLFQGTPLGAGSAFVWFYDNTHYLITNWHNVTGIHPETRVHLLKNAGEPDTLEMYLDFGNLISARSKFRISIRDADGQPLWLEHPEHGSKVDVVAIPLTHLPDHLNPRPINHMVSRNMLLRIGMEAFIIGYPYGISTGAAFPIWKRASIASEPDQFVNFLPMFYVDSASRPGMSGAPVILRTWNSYYDEKGVTHDEGPHSRLIGVYSGRIHAKDELQAQLGIVWRAAVVTEIVAAQRRGSIP